MSFAHTLIGIAATLLIFIGVCLLIVSAAICVQALRRLDGEGG